MRAAEPAPGVDVTVIGATMTAGTAVGTSGMTGAGAEALLTGVVLRTVVTGTATVRVLAAVPGGAMTGAVEEPTTGALTTGAVMADGLTTGVPRGVGRVGGTTVRAGLVGTIALVLPVGMTNAGAARGAVVMSGLVVLVATMSVVAVGMSGPVDPVGMMSVVGGGMSGPVGPVGTTAIAVAFVAPGTTIEAVPAAGVRTGRVAVGPGTTGIAVATAAGGTTTGAGRGVRDVMTVATTAGRTGSR